MCARVEEVDSGWIWGGFVANWWLPTYLFCGGTSCMQCRRLVVNEMVGLVSVVSRRKLLLSRRESEKIATGIGGGKQPVVLKSCVQMAQTRVRNGSMRAP